MQDRQGFIWVGTQDGLDRYDGYTFKIFRPVSNDPLSISDRWINALFQDKAGYIWVGTRQGGLNRYDPLTGSFMQFTHDPADPSSLVSDRVQVIFEDSQARLWVGTTDGLDRFSHDGGFEHYVFDAARASNASGVNARLFSDGLGDNITSIFEDDRGTLWVGSASSGLNRYDEHNDVFVNYAGVAPVLFTLSSNTILSIGEDLDGNLWVATDKGINLLNPVTGRGIQFQHSPDDPGSLASNTVSAVYVDSLGSVWVGTSDGLDWYDRSSRSFVHYRNDPRLDASLSNNIVTAISESRDGVLWVGTSGGGLNRYDREQGRFKYYHFSADAQNNLSGNIIRSINIDQNGNVWIGTLDGGVDWLDPNTGLVTQVLNNLPTRGGLGSNEVWSVYSDHADNLWIGTSSGLDMLASDSTDFIHYQHDSGDPDSLVGSPVVAVAEDAARNLWIGTKFGLDRFDAQNNIFYHYHNDPGNSFSLSGNEIKTLFVDRSGNLWIGTANDGLDLYDPVTGLFHRFQYDPDDPASISSNAIISIFQDRLGTLWVGTDGGGLNRLDAAVPAQVGQDGTAQGLDALASGSFTHFGEQDGLPNSVIYGIQQDDQGLLWLSTNNGISSFDPASGRSVRNFTVDDGLQGNEFSPNASTRDLQGDLYFGGVNGLTVFDPGLIGSSTFFPPVVLLSITQDGLPLNRDVVPEYLQEVTLHWPQRSFEFEYSALSYAQPSKNQYAYMLENFDQAWNMVGTRRDGRYTNLPGGSYILRIKASNPDGIWNESGFSMRVKVVPAIWQTLWFQIAVAGGVLALGLTAYWGRVRSIQAYNRELERQVRDRTQEIEKLFERTKELAVVEERNRLARELHDSAKQKAFAALAQLGTANGILKKDPRAAKNHLVEAENLVYEVIEELTFLIQEMYPVALKEKGLAATLRDYVFEWEGRTDIQADVRIEGERRLRLDIEQAVYRVIQEALSNVSRHSRASHVEVVLSYKADSVVVIVADNGCGFDQKMAPSGVGLRSIRERVESLAGVVEIESLTECGTCLTVHLPVGQNDEQAGNRSVL